MKQKFIEWFKKEGFGTIYTFFASGFLFFLGLFTGVKGEILTEKIPLIQALFFAFTIALSITTVIGIIGASLQKRNAKK